MTVNKLKLSAVGLAILCVLALAGCSTTANIDTQYYLLHNPTAVVTQSDTKQTVLFSLAPLPAYLNQPHLVMQLDEHQIHHAKHHRWAEPLNDAVAKALLNDLNQTGGNSHFIRQNRKNTSSQHPTLAITIEHFHSYSEAKVILSGSYWLNPGASDQPSERAFFFEMPLTADGYAHSVSQMRALLGQLADQIVAQQ